LIEAFEDSGVALPPERRTRFKEISDRLTELAQEFAKNIRENTSKLTFTPAECEGLPQSWLDRVPRDEQGHVVVGYDYPDYVPFMTYARSEAARAELWRAYRLRAHPANLEVLSRLLARRAELAGLLGHPTWASYVTEDKMIGSEQAAADFVARITALSGPRMEREYAQLLSRKRAEAPGAERVEPWDATFLQERIKAEQYGFESQSVRPYLEYGRVRDGLLEVTGALLGVEYRRLPDAPAWHPEVEAYEVVDRAGGEPLGLVWLDMHPRQGKYQHFAQFTLSSGVAGRRLPEGVLVCNFPRPREGAPALLEHGEVRTFFHEFGHLLHHVLGGRTRFAAHSGVATEWDFVEAPSQMLEEWVWDPGVLARFARHVGTGEPIPPAMVARMKAADEYGKGLLVRQQMFYAAVSLELHRRPPEALDTTALVAELQARYTPFRPVEGTYFHESFGHLDGYSAIYYTYMWSLVIAKDLFARFHEAGLMDHATAQRYRKAILEPGGSRPAAELVRDFMGRESAFEAYEKWLNAAA